MLSLRRHHSLWLLLLSLAGFMAPAFAQKNVNPAPVIKFGFFGPDQFEKAEFRLEPARIESAFGIYCSKITIDGEKAVYVRRITMHRGRFPAAAYTDWVDFRRKVAKADQAQMVIVKNN